MLLASSGMNINFNNFDNYSLKMADYRYPHIVQRPSKPPEEYAKIEVAYVSHLIVFVCVCACVCAQFMF